MHSSPLPCSWGRGRGRGNAPWRRAWFVMLFNSGIFLFVFLPITAAVFFLLGRHRRPRLALFWLTVTSFFFYAWWKPAYLLLLFLSLGVNYLLGVRLARQGRGSPQAHSTLVLGIVFNLGLLA